MIIINTNKKQLYYRLLILIVLWVFFFYFFNRYTKATGTDILEIINLLGVGLAALYYTPVVIVTMLFRTIKVTITSDTISVFRVLMGTRTLAIREIDSFSTQSLHSANGRHERVTITYGGNRKLEITDVNVETILPILEALRDNTISYTGHTEKQSRASKQQG